MRHNYTIRRSSLYENYDIEYVCDPERPRIREVIDKPRKTRFINTAADYDAWEVQVIDFEDVRLYDDCD